jgi:Arc/MetJ-type ribon-helix-helix transcriptional regulator
MAQNITKLSVSLPKEVLAWVDEQVDAHRFASRSHGITLALVEMRERSETVKRQL